MIDTLETALALLFAPVGVVLYPIKSRSKGRKARLAMLIPEIRDLEQYAEVRRILAAQGAIQLTASSASDAALRMLITIEATRASNQFAALSSGSFLCRIITFGIVPWNEKQKTRTYARSVFSGSLSGLENYRTAAAIFKNRWQRVPAKLDRRGNQIESERSFITTFSGREMIADNIAKGEAWYHDIATYVNQKESREQLSYERKEMHEMVEGALFDDESKRRFIHVCHESWRRRLGKLGERSRTENLGEAGFRRLVRKEAEKLRTSFARSKNAETLRETVIDFWARAGTNKDLRGDGLMKVLPLFNDANWREARDLALLALISYQPQDEVEDKALIPETTEEGEES
jgi:CRISPR-associated protein Cas8a1/Csx13